MEKFLNKLRQKSDLQKRIIAFWSAFFLTFLITTIWLISEYSLQISQFNLNQDTEPSPQLGNGQSASPFEVIKSQIEDIKEVFENI